MEFNWNFDTDRGGFVYRDDVFRFTSQPKYAAGAYTTSGGYRGTGALSVTLGGVDEADIAGMSGAWSTGFTLTETQDVTLTFRFKIDQGSDYEASEYTDLMVALDGETFVAGGNPYVARISGDGNGGAFRTTGWRTVTIDLGELGPGQHNLQLGGFSNQKTTFSERTKLFFDDVKIATTDVDGGGTGGGGGGTPPGGGSLEAFEARVLELTNNFRAQNGKAALGNDTKLNAAAEDWSHDMATGDFFRHSTPAQVEEQGYAWRNWGENIAAGYSTPEAVVQGWINSPGHRANMLSDNFKEIGIGYYYLANDTGSVNYRHYWTQVFGTEQGDNLV